MGRLFIALAFFLSGASGLAFQTVWVRTLTRYFGATTPAVATVLGVFMAGLALGSGLGGRLADRVRRPLRAYALIEVAIAVVGLLAFYAVLTRAGDLYVGLGRSYPDRPWVAALGRFAFVAVCLLPPTVLMGATLPLLVAHASRRSGVQKSLGRLYAANTLGAFAGVVGTGFYLLGEFGEANCILIAAGMNLAAALLAFAAPAGGPAPVGDAPAVGPGGAAYEAGARRWALAAFFVSGFTALAYEVLWSRLLVLYLETSIYAFSAMLGLFLIGIAAGSWAASVGRPSRRPLAEFGQLEVLIGCATVFGLLLYPWLEPAYDLNDTTYGMRPSDLVRILIAFVLVVPVAFLFGRQFPVAVHCCARAVDGAGRLTGRAYTVNAVGTIVGSLATGFAIIPLLGVVKSMVLLAAVNVAIGLVLVLYSPAAERRPVMSGSAAAAALFAAGAYFVGDPYLSTVTARLTAVDPDAKVFAYSEGTAATCIAAGVPGKPSDRSLLVDGQGMTALAAETQLLTHLPCLLAKDPKRYMVVCFGMGTTTRSATQYPGLEIDAVDLVPQVFEYFPHFHSDAAAVRANPRVRFVVNDGRNQLLLADRPYDVITVDPAPPLHSAGTVNLYSREFFALAKSRLSDGGVFCMWLMPARESECLRVLKTFADVFPDGCLWGSIGYPGLYLTGGRRPVRPTPGERAELYRRLLQVRELGDWNPMYRDAAAVSRLYLLDCQELLAAIPDVPVITDDRPSTEFPLWRYLFDPAGKRFFLGPDLVDRDSPFWRNRPGAAKPAGVAGEPGKR